jgi:DnaJ-class molecular chaperone
VAVERFLMNVKPTKTEKHMVECPCCKGKGYQTFLAESGKEYDFKCNHCQGGGTIPSEAPETENVKLSAAD